MTLTFTGVPANDIFFIILLLVRNFNFPNHRIKLLNVFFKIQNPKYMNYYNVRL